jgi:uncharacterized membrane protein YfcA
LFDLATETIVLLALAAFAAGFIDSIAGGGGLVTVPVLLIAGLLPVEALATNKLQGLFGAGSATIAYAQKGHVDLREQVWAAGLAFAGGVAGAALATILPSDWLRAGMPVLLIAIALYFALKPDMGDVDRARRLTPFVFGVTVVPLIGFYDGLFGPGTGSFFMLAFVALAGYGVLKATAHTKLLNFASNVGGFTVFALAGAVWWKVGLTMGACQFVGARLGSALAMRIGARLIKPLLILVSVAMALRLLSAPDHPLRTLIGL